MAPFSRLVPRLVAPLGATLLSTLPIAPAAAVAVSPALVSFTPGVIGGNDTFTGSIGWDFQLERPYTVGALGFYDAEDPGLLSGHEVAIFDANSRAQLVSGSIPAGTAAPLRGDFRWVGIPLTTLAPGSYVIAAGMPGSGGASFDPFVALASDPVTAAGVVLGGRALSGAGTSALPLVFPDQDEDAFAGFYGPNFAAVPAPLPVFGGAVALGWSRRLRRRLRG
jgi:hypothetical protein